MLLCSTIKNTFQRQHMDNQKRKQKMDKQCNDLATEQKEKQISAKHYTYTHKD